MKALHLNIFIFLLLIGTLPSNAQSLRFLDVVQKPSQDVAVDAQINERGGYISFDRAYRSGCIGAYKVKVTFSKSLNTLLPGETFQATLSCENCNTPCGYKWSIVELFGASSIRSIEQYPNYIYNENIEFVSSSNGSSGVADWQAGRQNNIITLKYNPKKEVPLTGIKIVAANYHEIFIVFATGSNVSNTTSTNTEKPNLSCAWSSSYGDIHWNEGYYSTTTKKISGRLFERNGTWFYEGTWSEINIVKSTGKVFFEFTSPTEFKGYWTEDGSSAQGNWTGSGNCLLQIKH